MDPLNANTEDVDPNPSLGTTTSLERRLAFIGVIAALIVWQLTNVAVASAVASSALVGRRALASSVWIWKHDPVRPRARICSLFHLSVAVWLGAPAALLAIVAAVVVHKRLGLPLPESEVHATLIALLCSVVGSALMGLIASVSALIWKVRVWIHPHFVSVLIDELMQTSVRPASNFGIFILATSLASVALPIFGVLLLKPLPFQLPAWTAIVFVLLAITVVVLPTILFAARIFADGPRQYLVSHQTTAGTEPDTPDLLS